MPVDHLTEGYTSLTGVSFTGAEGAPGSILHWSGLLLHADQDNNYLIRDDDGDGRLDVGVDYFASAGQTFSGYTIDIGGTEYGVFSQGVNYWVPLPENGTTQSTIPNSGSSQVWQAEATTYLCFAAGSLIAIPAGERRVETLRIGDTVLSAAGSEVAVIWIGRQTVRKLFAGPRMQPVRIRAGALGDGLPHSDLTVTADHGMVLDGLVINASALVNGGSIDWVPMAELPDRVTYYHIETENHDVILANGAPAETFVDMAGRMAFDNYQEYLDLYGAERIVPEMDRPRIASQRLLPDAIKARLGHSDEISLIDQPLTA